MTDVIPVSAEWLALRESADARARSGRLAAAAAARLSRMPAVVHDLGTGTGSMMRWLAPRLGAPQTWVLHDWNPALLDHAARTSLPGVVARTRTTDLAQLRARDLAGASLVTMSALLDVLARDELESIVAACVGAGVPVLCTLSVTGRVSLGPPDAADGVFEAAFNDHQRRTVGGRRLLGPDAVAAATDLFAAAGWSVRAAHSPWRLDASDRDLIAAWLDGWLAAAVEQRPALRVQAEAYARRREAQRTAGALRVVVDHRDFLAWP